MMLTLFLRRSACVVIGKTKTKLVGAISGFSVPNGDPHVRFECKLAKKYARPRLCLLMVSLNHKSLSNRTKNFISKGEIFNIRELISAPTMNGAVAYGTVPQAY